MKKTMILIIVLTLALLNNGCLSSYPPNNVPFAEIHELKELNGNYENNGVGAAFDRTVLFSNLTWGRSTDAKELKFTNEQIKYIKVEALDEKTISRRHKSF